MRLGNFKEDWEIDPIEKEIRLKNISILGRLIRFRKRYPLSKFHAFVRQNYEATEAGIVEPVILNADYMKPVEGVPTKLQLVNGWIIPKKDLRKILGDKHVLICGGKVVVPESRVGIWSSIELKPSLWGISVDLKKLFGRK